MIKFFRHIRQKLLSENKFNKYLIYAFGEIVLVVIGILIALQINNWNNERFERRLETDILNEILVNLETDIQNIEIKKGANSAYIKANTKVIEHLKNKRPLTDSLRFYYSKLYGYGNFEPIKVGYENLKSRGLNLIKDQTLRKEISILYEYKYYDMVGDIRQAITHIQELHTDEIVEKLKSKSRNSREPVDLKSLQNDIKFENVTFGIIKARRWTNKNFDKGQQEIDKVITAIKNYLNKE